ncbi:MAG: retropepsin-like aspartic protease [Eubacteriales bacterium]|nr:retropepsin-like aspartic protease [Eubacteriales bacterium]MDD3073281.1 retropepsin-like aspartic protease [Eubacteriales bacterium]MDD4768827.1 retropepsin-like aspartic protease [Eubacteriales bacterium]
MENEILRYCCITQDIGNLRLISVSINGLQGMFLFDTGAQITCIRDSFFHNASGRLSEVTLKGGGSSGNAALLETGNLDSISIAGFTERNVTVGIIPDETMDYVFGAVVAFFLDRPNNSQDKIQADGILGWDVISAYRWEYDCDQKKLVISNERSYDSALNLSWDVFPIIDVKLNGTKAKMAFDSGHTETILAPSAKDAVMDLNPVTDNTVGFDGESGENAYCAEEVMIEITCEKIVLHDVVMYDRQLHGISNYEIAGLLGADLLEGKSWIIDFPSGEVRII